MNRWGWGCYGDDNSQTLGTYIHTGITSSDGRHEVRVEWKGIDDEPSAISVTAQAAVRDLNQQTQVIHCVMWWFMSGVMLSCTITSCVVMGV